MGRRGRPGSKAPNASALVRRGGLASAPGGLSRHGWARGPVGPTIGSVGRAEADHDRASQRAAAKRDRGAGGPRACCGGRGAGAPLAAVAGDRQEPRRVRQAAAGRNGRRRSRTTSACAGQGRPALNPDVVRERLRGASRSDQQRSSETTAPTAPLAGVRRRFAPHQLRHAHAVEMAREGIPSIIIQRQLGHTNLGITSINLQGIDSAEIIDDPPGALMRAPWPVWRIRRAGDRNRRCRVLRLSRVASAP